MSMPLIGLTSFLPWASGTPCLCWFAICDFPKVFPKGKNWFIFAKFLVFLKYSLVYHKSSTKSNWCFQTGGIFTKTKRSGSMTTCVSVPLNGLTSFLHIQIDGFQYSYLYVSMPLNGLTSFLQSNMFVVFSKSKCVNALKRANIISTRGKRPCWLQLSMCQCP